MPPFYGQRRLWRIYAWSHGNTDPGSSCRSGPALLFGSRPSSSQPYVQGIARPSGCRGDPGRRIHASQRPCRISRYFLSSGESSSSPITEARARGVSYPGVAGEELVGHVLMIFPGIAFTDAVLHQAGQGRQHADRRVDGLAGAASRSRTIWPSVIYPVRSGIGWVISSFGMVRIGICVTEPFLPHDAGALVQGGQLAVQIARIALSGRDLALGGGELRASPPRRRSYPSGSPGCAYPCSKARYSAAVKRTFGVMIRSTIGSLARLKNMNTWCRTPDSAKVRLKIPPRRCYAHGGKDDSEFLIAVSRSETTADDLRGQLVMWLMPLPEKIGSFWPRISVVRPSMAEIPVRI